MKKMLKLLGIMAALAMVMGMAFVSCKAEEEDSFKAEKKDYTFTALGIPNEYASYVAGANPKVKDEKIAKITVEADKITIESVKEGKTDVTGTIEGEEATIGTITVTADGKNSFALSDEIKKLLSDEDDTPAASAVNAAWNFEGNLRYKDKNGAVKNEGATDVDGVSATQSAGTGNAAPEAPIELTTNKTGSGAKMAVLGKCEWNGKLQFATGSKDGDLFTITTDEACTAVIKVSSASSSKSSGKVNALKLGGTVIYDFDAVDTVDATEKTVSLAKGENLFKGSGVSIHSVTCK